MKKPILILFVFICLLGLAFLAICLLAPEHAPSALMTQVPSGSVASEKKSDEIIGSFDPDISKSYDNKKFWYTISYPKQWEAGPENPAQDGLTLYHQNGNEIRVYGGYDVAAQHAKIEKMRQAGMQIMDLVNINGVKGVLITGDLAGEKYLEYIQIRNRHCNFYAKVTPQYYERNKDGLVLIAKTLTLLKLAE